LHVLAVKLFSVQTPNGINKHGGEKGLGEEGIGGKIIARRRSAEHQKYGSVWKLRLH